MIYVYITAALLSAAAIASAAILLHYYRSTYYHVTRNGYFRTHRDVGLYGEYRTYLHLRALERTGARFLFNCYLPREDGTTTEIDILLICNSGVYVFESKNYSGWIFGSAAAHSWTQVLPQGRGRRARKERFLNPILQNQLHIQCLRQMLAAEVPVHSVIVFSERCTFKELNGCGDVPVIHRPAVRQTVADIGSTHAGALSADTVDAIYRQLYPCTQVSGEVRAEHIRSIQSRLSAPTPMDSVPASAPKEHPVSAHSVPSAAEPDSMLDSTDAPVCPRCGAPLLLRTASRGAHRGQSFYGCSRFPQCRYTRQLETPAKTGAVK